MAGGVLGTLPGVILATIFGANIKNPKSPAFWLSAVLLVMISVFSILIHRHISGEEKITGLSLLPAFTERKKM